MSKEDYSVIDANKWEPIQSPGLRSAKHQLAYDSQQVQMVLSESFSTMFPSIVDVNKKQKRYQSVNSSGRDIFSQAVPAKNLSDIPRAETMRLMEGWIRLRRKLQEENHPDNVTAILLNFRVPNPRQSLDRYMIYKKGDETRLIIRWGFETKEDKAVSLERAISILMDVPLGHMRSILSTTMSQTTSTVPVGPMLAAEEARELLDRNNREVKRSSKLPMVATIVGFFALLGGGYVFSVFDGKLNKDNGVDDSYVFMTEFDEAESQPVVEKELEEVEFVGNSEELEIPVAKPGLNTLMEDLVVGAAKKDSSEQAPLNLDTMISGSDSSNDTANLIGEMMQ